MTLASVKPNNLTRTFRDPTSEDGTENARARCEEAHCGLLSSGHDMTTARMRSHELQLPAQDCVYQHSVMGGEGLMQPTSPRKQRLCMFAKGGRDIVLNIQPLVGCSSFLG